jgi:hypothetical protein
MTATPPAIPLVVSGAVLITLWVVFSTLFFDGPMAGLGRDRDVGGDA